MKLTIILFLCLLAVESVVLTKAAADWLKRPVNVTIEQTVED